MSSETTLTMQDLELETAELLPSRETLCSYQPCHPSCCGSGLEVLVFVKICL